MAERKLFEKIADIMRTIQHNSANHSKCVHKLKALYIEENDQETFILCLKKCLMPVLRCDYKMVSPFATKVMQFISSFCVLMQEHEDPEEDSPIVIGIVKFLSDMSNNVSENIHYRACEFISTVFQALAGYEISTELCDIVQEAMCISFEDKSPKVRRQAAEALAPLQSPDGVCEVTELFVTHLQYDPSPLIRRVCAERIALRKEVIGKLVDSSRDNDSAVRSVIFKRALKYPCNFKIIHKQQLLLNGYSDSCEMIRNFVIQELIPTWLQYYENNYLKYISGLRLDATWSDINQTLKVTNYVLEALFTQRTTDELTSVLKFDERKLLAFGDLGMDQVIYWKMYLQELRKKNYDDEFAPQLPHFIDYIREYCAHGMNAMAKDVHYEKLKFRFILSHLARIAMGYQYVDPKSKQMMNELIEYVLKTCELDLETVGVLVEVLNLTMPDLNAQSNFMCNLLGDIIYALSEENETQPSIASQRDPVVDNTDANGMSLNCTKAQYALSELKIKYHNLNEQLENAISNRDFLKANELKALVDDLSIQIKEITKPGTLEEIPEAMENNEQLEDEEASSVDNAEPSPAIVAKILMTMAGFLTSSKIRSMNDTLRMFKETFIVPMVHSQVRYVRLMALRCLSLCCTIDEPTAKVTMSTMFAIIKLHNQVENGSPIEIVLMCAGTIIDSILIFGTHIVAAPMDNSKLSVTDNEEENEVFANGTSLRAIIKEFTILMNDENTDVQEVACRGLCNLIIMSRIQSSTVMSKLLLKYLLPTSSELASIRLQQYIGLAFEKFPTVPNTGTQLQKAIIPTIRILLKAPPHNPLSAVDIENAAKLMIDLCGTYHEREILHENIVRSLIREMHERPHHMSNVMYAKMLAFVRYMPVEKQFLTELQNDISELRDLLGDAKAVGFLVKFNTKITLLLSSSTEAEISAVSDNNTIEPPFEE